MFGEIRLIDKLPRVDPKAVAAGSLRAAKRGKAVYTRLFLQILPPFVQAAAPWLYHAVHRGLTYETRHLPDPGAGDGAAFFDAGARSFLLKWMTEPRVLEFMRAGTQSLPRNAF